MSAKLAYFVAIESSFATSAFLLSGCVNSASASKVSGPTVAVSASIGDCIGCTAMVPNQQQPLKPCKEMLELLPAQRVSLVAFSQNNAAVSGTWMADFGKVLPGGTYVAPANVVAEGADYLTFISSDGTISQYIIRISDANNPNPDPEAPTIVFDPVEPSVVGTIPVVEEAPD